MNANRPYKKAHWKKISSRIFLGLLLSFIGGWIYLRTIQDVLILNEPVQEADVLVVESWMPTRYFRKVAREFHKGGYEKMVLTGGKLHDGFSMCTNGSLIFDFRDQNITAIKEFSVKANGSVCDGIFPEMIVRCNDKLLKVVSTTQIAENYLIEFPSEREVKKISIEFTNDAYNSYQDRNLTIFSIDLDGKRFLPRSENVIYDLGYTKVATNYNYYPEYAAMVLVDLGISKDELILIRSSSYKGSKTHGAAKDFSEWYTQNIADYDGVNIMTTGIHTRRTLMLFKEELEGVEMGVIPVSQDKNNTTEIWKSKIALKNVIKETIGIIYYTFFG